MSEREIPRRDRLHAALLDVGSQWAVMFPGVLGRWFGPDNKPRRWYATTAHADTIPWQEFSGDDEAGHLPPDYHKGVVLGVPRIKLSRPNQELFGTPAAFYAVGKAVPCN